VELLECEFAVEFGVEIDEYGAQAASGVIAYAGSVQIDPAHAWFVVFPIRSIRKP
jgi:hypothetical protein